MIGYSLRRDPGGRRYSSTDRALARDAADADLPDTLTPEGRAAMLDPNGIEAVVDVLFERESNRLRRPTTTVLGALDAATYLPLTVDDPAMDLVDLSSGRHNPSKVYGVADVTTLDSGAVVFTRGPGEELPVAWKRDQAGRELVSFRISPNPSGAVLPDGVRGTVLTQAGVSGGIGPAGGFDLARSLSPTDAGRLADTLPTVWYTTNFAKSGRVEQKVPASAHYRLPVEGRRFTIGFDIATDTEDKVRGGIGYRITPEGGALGAKVYLAGPEYVSTFAGAETSKRITTTVTVPHPDPVGGGAYYVAEIGPYVDLIRLGGTRLELANLHAYAGDPRPFEDGVLTATPQYPDVTPYVEQTWSGSRHVNAVEVSGEHRLGQITSASVDVRTGASTWSRRGSASGTGRLSIPVGTTIDDEITGVRVFVEETTGIEASSTVGSPIYVQEVDPMFVDDVSEEVASLDVTWSREADPATATSPFGNYEASTVNLDLDDTTGKYNPATNATLDLGHRIETAIGVRYSNRFPNPRADLGGEAWRGGIVASGDEWPDDAPHPRGFTVTVTVPGSGSVISSVDRIPIPAAAATVRAGGWFQALGAGSSMKLIARGYTLDDMTEVAGTVVSTAGEEWQYLTSTWVVDAVNYPAAGFEVDLAKVGTAAPSVTGYTTDLRLEFLDAAGELLKVEEVLPAGVFYSEPYETDSSSPTVSISGVDRIGRLQTVAVDEPVRVGQTAGQVIRDLALRYLDLDADQVSVGPTAAGYVIPYAYAAGGQIGTYLADLAKATVSTLHVDAFERLAVNRRSDSNDTDVEIRADNALIGHKRPAGIDVTTSIVTVNAAPLVKDPEAELWAMPAGGVTVLQGETYDLVANYANDPAADAFVTGIVADGAYTITESRFGSSRAIVRIENEEARTLVVADARIRGRPLVESPLTARKEHAPSVARYGPRELTIDAPLIQTQAQVDAVASVLLDTFRSLDDAGVRRIPDLTLDALGILFLEAGDRVAVSDPAKGVGGDYAILSRKLSYQDAALLLNDVRVREAADVAFGIVGESDLDSGVVAGY